MTLVMVMVAIAGFAGDIYKVELVKIGQKTEVVCEGLKNFYAGPRDPYRNFFNSLRSGDIIEVREYENRILGVRKIGHEAPSYPNGGVLLPEGNGYYYYGGSGYYGGGSGYYYGGGVSATIPVGNKGGGVSIDVPLGGIINAVSNAVAARKARKAEAREAAATRMAEARTTTTTVNTSVRGNGYTLTPVTRTTPTRSAATVTTTPSNKTSNSSTNRAAARMAYLNN